MTNVIPGPPYPGTYEHYKGGFYVVHKILADATNRRQNKPRASNIMVLYESLERGCFHVREVREFLESVHPEDGRSSVHFHRPNTACPDCIPRFKWVVKPSEVGRPIVWGA